MRLKVGNGSWTLKRTSASGPGLFLCCLILSCQNTTIPESESIFPLSPGSSWQFSPGGRDSILDAVKIDGRCYSQFLTSPVGLGPPFLREHEKDQVFFWNGQREQLLLDFSAAVRDSWGIDLEYETFAIHYTVTLVSKLTKVATRAGEFDHCFGFDFTSTDVIDGNWIVVVAPGTGVVLRKGGNFATHPLDFSPRGALRN